ncbi:MAG: thiolase family protein [Betaproteobacteria bacterium]|nr:MAG: thiolase family protein [Betaproteobacteria bacterium]
MNSVAVIAEAARTPFGRFCGKLRHFSAVDLGALAASAVMTRAGVQPGDIDETLFGTAILAASTSVAARQINFKVGIPASTPSLTLDRACCSSMTALGLALAKIRAGDASIVIAGGIESCSQMPFLLKGTRSGRKLGDFTVEDPMQVRNPITGLALTLVTGRKALEHGVSREEQDEWACASHQRYFAAFDRGVYAGEILAIDVPREGELKMDESPRRDTSLEKLRSLPTAYGSPTVTAGNAPGLNDGGSALLVMSSEEARRRGVRPLVEVVAYAQASGDLESSVYMPGHAMLKALKKADIALEELKRIEINEAFAAMPLVSTQVAAGGDAAKTARLRAITNVNGGAVAIGHPPGASGARIVMALARELRRLGGGYGAASICGGYGQSDAVILKV